MEALLPLISTLALFILFSNLMGLVPGFAPPTDNLETTAVCAVIVSVLELSWLRQRLRLHRPHGEPGRHEVDLALAPLMFPIELIGHLAGR